MAILLSLTVNVLIYVVLSLLARPRLVDTVQARIFVGDLPEGPDPGHGPIRARLRDIEHLLARFIGPEEAGKAVLELRSHSLSGQPSDDEPITPTQVRIAEKLLAGVIGAPSARNVVSLAISSDDLSSGEIDHILDDAAEAVHFSRDLLQIALQGLDQGVSVVDRDHRLIAWNGRYMQLLNLSAAEVYVGKPLSDLLLERSDGEVVNAIRSNLLGLNGSIARGEPLQEEWHLEDGRILEVTGKPLPRGDYLSTLADITSLREAERVLAQDKESLERRVELRTRELTAANSALAEAKRAAEDATGAQKRFVAAASHDLVQPLHAARLFISSVKEGADLSSAHSDLLRRADDAVDGAFRLMRALLNLSRLETSAAEPAVETVALDPIFASLCEEFADQAEARGLRFVVRPTTFHVTSDGDLLRSVIQNLVLNAIRYTPSGTILVTARPAGTNIRLEVRDTGIGIDAAHLEAVFSEFNRLPQAEKLAAGSGLGLSIVARICHFLGHPVSVRSKPDQGSIFSVVIPRAKAAASPRRLAEPTAGQSLDGMTVLCIDDEPDVLLGMKALLERWGARVDTAGSGPEIPATAHGWSAIVADQLLPGETGISILRRLAGQARLRILLTATAQDDWEDELAAEGIRLMRKPAPPLQLRALLASVCAQSAVGTSATTASN
nr:ATP-binding protein [Novosphingobium flavum]